MTESTPRPFMHLVKPSQSPAVLRINVTELYSVREWSNRYGCTAAELRAAVAAVGNVASDVEAHLRPVRDRENDRIALREAFTDQPTADDRS